MLITLCLFIMLSFSNTLVQASVLVEPYYGMAFSGRGDFSVDFEGNTSEVISFKYSGLFPGARLGYEYLGLMLGTDYAVSSFQLKDAKENSKDNVARTDWGLVLGYNFPLIPLRIWAKWILQSKLKGRNKDPKAIFSKDSHLSGGGQSLGIGWKVIPLISFNLEYRSVEYDDYKRNGRKVADYTNKLDLHDFFFSVSVPLTF